MLTALLPSDKYTVRFFGFITTCYFSLALIFILPKVIDTLMPVWMAVLGDMADTPEGSECTTASRQQELRDADPEGE